MKKTKLIFLFLLASFIFFALTLVMAPKKSSNVDNKTENTTNQVSLSMPIAPAQTVKTCFHFNSQEITPLINSLENVVISKIKEEKKYNIYWGLSTDKKEAELKFQDLKTKGLFENEKVQLTYIGKQYSLLVSQLNNDKEALKQVIEMTEKTKSIGGKWFYSSVIYPFYHVKFTTDNNNSIQSIASQYKLKKCK